MGSVSREQLESWLKRIDVKSDLLLDIGGSQNPIKGRTKSWNVKEWKILDLAKPHECKQKQDISIDLNKIMGPNEIINESIPVDAFDTAFCIEVTEYLWNPVQAFKNIYNLLKKDGVLYISTHFIYKCHPPEGQDFLRYTPYGIEKILHETGFEILEHTQRVTESLLLSAYYSVDRMRGHTQISNEVTGSLIKCKKI